MRAPSRARTVSCHGCGQHFETRHSQAKYCSPGCSGEGERVSWRAYGARNRSARRRYYTEQYYPANRGAVIAKTTAYSKSPAGKLAVRTTTARQREKWPEKYRARQAVRLALCTGQLVRQPCGRCSHTKAQAHHPDYSKPLAVVWLCTQCHADEHKSASDTEEAAA